MRNDAKIMYAECTVAHLTFISIAMLAALVFLCKSIDSFLQVSMHINESSFEFSYLARVQLVYDMCIK